MASRIYDIVLWGSTGFTGKLATKYMLQTYYKRGDVTWAIAGRNREKLEGVLTSLSEKLGGIDTSHVDILVGGVDDISSLQKITKSCKVLLSTSGPFARVGSPMVDACVSTSTNYVDITGEGPWVRKMIDKHHDEAKAKNIKLISCCGFDCVPCDIGTLYIVEDMKKRGIQPTQVTATVVKLKGEASGGTIESVFNMFQMFSFTELAASMSPYLLCPREDQQSLKNKMANGDKTMPSYDSTLKKWVQPFVMQAIDTRIVHRSNALKGYDYGKDFVYGEAMVAPNALVALVVCALSPLAILLIVPAFRSLFRMFVRQPGQGPSDESMAKGMMEFQMKGKGINQSTGDHSTTIATIVNKCGDPGYSQTAKMVCESALCLIKEETPGVYGYVTPASGLGMALHKRLSDRGFEFRVGGV